ncbi:MAG: DNA-directed RNA polymerase subunit beta' [Dehalococcoidia bacterium]|nr:DNA-directed RNA polymerase subunit beta' [Dehalococcoidia bacterium]
MVIAPPGPQTTNNGTEFSAIKISLASPDQILAWSHGEVTKAETINYRTLRPERDGLFCERIFGPTKDWECACGKYKKIRYKGVVCERCGVEVTRSKVRRERNGHIKLAAPVAHIWFSKGIPSRLGLLLDLSPRNLERILYFAQHVIVDADEDGIKKAMDKAEADFNKAVEKLEGRTPGKDEPSNAIKGEELQEQLDATLADLDELRPMKLLVESRYRELRDKYPGLFRASMGAESVLELLRKIDLDKLAIDLYDEMRRTSGQRHRKALKRLHVVRSFLKSGNKPEWMVLTVLPVLPPELRPMVQLDGGRFATSDLNDLYRRVINRNNRLQRLLELEAPEIIIRNEKRMLQEAVDALIDNGRRTRAVAARHNHKLKSLSDLLRGKQGRFRQNLLGKRVDYSGRSVIVVGPELRLDQCGLPKRMALELFKPLVMHRLVAKGLVPNIRSAKRSVERVRPEVWDVLEEVIKDRPVLLNRAPTLHRLGIQAFMPVLIEGSAIQIHPMVCTPFNADFDGDQMAVHVPLSRRAVAEAKEVMLSTHNLLSPASGEPLVTPALDLVLGCYYLTMLEKPTQEQAAKDSNDTEAQVWRFSDVEEVRLALNLGQVRLQTAIKYLLRGKSDIPSQWVDTTVGRIIFREIVPSELVSDQNTWNKLMDKKALRELVGLCYRRQGDNGTVDLLDAIKRLGYHYATFSGISIGIHDLDVPPEKGGVISRAEGRIEQLEEQYQTGLLSGDERRDQAIRIWTEASDEMSKIVEKALPSFGGVYLMAQSGAKGNISQIKQMAGMRGLMSDPKGQLIEVPVKSSFREGHSVLEYFISTHGARKGLADTALRTADSGYLTRRMVDVAQDVITTSEDCGTPQGVWIRHDREKERSNYVAAFTERIVGRIAAEAIADVKTGEIIVDRNQEITEDLSKKLWDAGIREAYVRSPITCDNKRGICILCFGRMPATSKMVRMGEAVGIVAAQSIGEPGTQLTMRTFHTGGIAGVDITSGIPRVEELFEARVPKYRAILAEIDGKAEITETPDGWRIRVASSEEYREEYRVPKGFKVVVDEGDLVGVGAPLALPPARRGAAKEELAPERLVSQVAGKVTIKGDKVSVVWSDQEERVYVAPLTATLLVKSGDVVKAGQELTKGPKDPHDILRIQGGEAVQQYILEEIQKVYRAQGVTINDRHVEIIIRQMLRRVRVDHPGDTDLLPEQIVDRFKFEDINQTVLAQGGEPARATPRLMGITRASLGTDSFLATASFLETARVLTEAAVSGEVDYLRGLKENVILGRLIPTRHIEIEEQIPESILSAVDAATLESALSDAALEVASLDDKRGLDDDDLETMSLPPDDEDEEEGTVEPKEKPSR